MNLSIFDILGPVMIGPSSSHTAGAAKLARVAARLAPAGFVRVTFGLAGSFAKTGRGHGTDKALLAGALGLAEDDEGIRDAFALARQRGVAYAFETIELPDSHENSVRITFYSAEGHAFVVEGSSLGGGRICITKINNACVEFTAEAPTIIVRQQDKKGVVSQITGILAENGINIGVMRVTREAKGDIAGCLIETDAVIPHTVERALHACEHVLDVTVLNI